MRTCESNACAQGMYTRLYFTASLHVHCMLQYTVLYTYVT